VQWDERQLKLTYKECGERLREGEPRIEVNVADEEINLASYNLFPGEERIIGWRLREVLSGRA
jgi:hypothetical protein